MLHTRRQIVRNQNDNITVPVASCNPSAQSGNENGHETEYGGVSYLQTHHSRCEREGEGAKQRGRLGAAGRLIRTFGSETAGGNALA